MVWGLNVLLGNQCRYDRRGEEFDCDQRPSDGSPYPTVVRLCKVSFPSVLVGHD